MIPKSWKFWKEAGENKEDQPIYIECPQHGKYELEKGRSFYCPGCKKEEKLNEAKKTYNKAYQNHDRNSCEQCQTYEKKYVCLDGIESCFYTRKTKGPKAPYKIFYRRYSNHLPLSLKNAIENPSRVQHTVVKIGPICDRCGWTTNHKKEVLKYHNDRCEGEDTKCI